MQVLRSISAQGYRCLVATAVAVCALAGCTAGPPYPAAPAGMPPGMYDPQYGGVAAPNNQIIIPNNDPNLVWDQLVDVVDNYFEVAREDRVKMIGDIPTEGVLETVPRGSSTILEPWNRDTPRGYERWEATLQSMRRIGTFRLIPVPQGGFLAEAVVEKQLEDVASPDAVFVGDESLRNDNSIRRFTNNATGSGASLGWIPKGRDYQLEQEILCELRARFSPQFAPQTPVFMSENPAAQPATTAEWKPTSLDPPARR